MTTEFTRVQQLIDLYFDDLISAEEMTELETCLQDSPDAVELFCEQADLQVMLHRVASSEARAGKENLIHFPPVRIQYWLTATRRRKVMALAASFLIVISLALIGTSTQGENVASIIPLGPGIHLDRGGTTISVTNQMLLVDDDQIYVATNSHAKIHWSDSCNMDLEGYSQTRYDTERAWLRRFHKVFIMLGVVDVVHDKARRNLKIGTPHMHYTRVKNSKVTFVVRPEHTHLKVAEGQLVATASRNGEIHHLSAGDEAVILHGTE